MAAGSGDLKEWYASHTRQRGFHLDEAQLRAVDRLQRLHDGLLAEGQKGWLAKLLKRKEPVGGLYLWGGVGRGKSFLLDGFFSCAQVERKKRIHFHRFMQEVHAELQSLKGVADPLVTVARRIAREARLLCFDEFHVGDIADAMLLGRLLREMLKHRVVLVATSNDRPDELYKNGLQHASFLPAIDLIMERLDVVEVDGGADYRLRVLEKVEIYHCPLDEAAEANLDSAYFRLAGETGKGAAALEIAGRRIMARHLAPGVAWFDFQELCSGPRGQADYIEIARRFHTVLISGIPQLGPEQAAEARRFTWLVDEFYDRRVKLIVSAGVPPSELYSGGPNGEEFARTKSRLAEMQSRQYLAQAHLP